MGRPTSLATGEARGRFTEPPFWADPPFNGSPMRRAWARACRCKRRSVLEQYLGLPTASTTDQSMTELEPGERSPWSPTRSPMACSKELTSR
jgi:hypothetical protein